MCVCVCACVCVCVCAVLIFVPVKLAFLKEPAVMKFQMAEPASVDQLEILHGEDHLFPLNVTGNTTVSRPGQRMRVEIQNSTDFLTVTLTLMNTTCIDKGSYVVIARGKEREERKTMALKVSSEYLNCLFDWLSAI